MSVSCSRRVQMGVNLHGILTASIELVRPACRCWHAPEIHVTNETTAADLRIRLIPALESSDHSESSTACERHRRVWGCSSNRTQEDIDVWQLPICMHAHARSALTK